MATNLENITPDLAEYLETEGLRDVENGEWYRKPVLTRDTFEDFKNGASTFKGSETENFDGIEVKVLNNFQARKGDARRNFYYLNFHNKMQNIVIFN